MNLLLLAVSPALGLVSPAAMSVARAAKPAVRITESPKMYMMAMGADRVVGPHNSLYGGGYGMDYGGYGYGRGRYGGGYGMGRYGGYGGYGMGRYGGYGRGYGGYG